jgi:hypothetical protein
MMQSSRPIDHRVGLIIIQADGPANTTAGVQLTKLKKSIKDGTIFSDIEPL